MSIGFWNIRGANRKNALAECKDFCKSSKIKILMLCEVKVQAPPSLAIARKCGFEYFNFVPPIGFSGGLWVFWRDCNVNPFNLAVVYKDSRFLVCSINFGKINVPFLIVFIYAPTQQNQKAQFWEDLISYLNLQTLPFVVLGDFNELSNINDKQGGGSFCFSKRGNNAKFFV